MYHGKNIQTLRKKHGLTIDQLCVNVNSKFNASINKSMVSKWENAKADPSIVNLVHLCRYFKVSAELMVNGIVE